MNQNEQQHLLRRLLDLREAKTTSMAPGVHVQATSHYIDAEHFRKESEAFFQRGALIAALSADLPAPGSFLALQLAGVPVLLVRGNDGIARAFLNACRHRGAVVATGRGGAREEFRCPYHAWSYEMDGRLKGKPGGPEAFPDLPSSCAGLLPLPAQEASGMVLVRPLVGGPPVDARAELSGLAAELEGHDFASFTYFSEHQSSWAMNWKQPYETFLEAYHIFSLHSDSLAHQVMSTPMLCDDIGPHGRGLIMGRRCPELLQRPVEEWSFNRHANLVYWLFPNTVLSLPMTGHAELWQFYPEGVDRTRVHTRFYVPKNATSGPELAFWDKTIKFSLNFVTTEDFPQQEAIFTNLRTAQLSEIHFGRNEPSLTHYHQSLARGIEPYLSSEHSL